MGKQRVEWRLERRGQELRVVDFVALASMTLLLTAVHSARGQSIKPGLVQPRSQAFLNLDFESATPQGLPLNWFIEAEGRSDAQVSINSAHVRSGRRALWLASSSAEPVPLYTPLFIEDECAKEVSFSGSAFAEEQGAVVIPVLFSPGGRRAIGQQVAISKDEWRIFQHRIVSEPGECLPKNLKLGLLFRGPGNAWIDDFSVTVDGLPLRSLRRTPPPRRSDIRTLAAAAIDLHDYAPGTDSMTRARALAPFSSARVIGLGENSHGAAALFSAKLALIQFFVREGGCTVVALEAPAVAIDAVNEYVLGRTSDLKSALESLAYPSWQTAEMQQVIEWLREYNRSSRAAVQFRGFDVQHPEFAIGAAEKIIVRAANSELIGSMGALRDAMAAGPSGLAEALTLVSALRTRLSTSDRLISTDRIRLERYLRILDSGLRMDRPDLGGKSRDAYMADEVMALIKEVGTDDRIILWADNTHVTRAGRAMGATLFEQLHDGYVPVGFTFNRGSYSAYGAELRYPVQQSFPGTHEYLLSRAGRNEYLVVLHSLPDTNALRQVAGFRYIGSRPQTLNQFHPHRLEEHFDVVVYVESTDSTHFLFSPKFD
jgi:erythromycin esterase